MIKTIIIIIAGWATTSLMIDGFTGWGEKGEYKKSIIAGLISIPIIALIYIIIGNINK